jgi:Zn-dependent protease
MLGVPFYITILAFLVAIVFHEAAHAWMANRLGDPTPKLKGRLSLNPIVHIDPYGTILIPMMLILLRFPIVFGWAKPVEFDPYNLKNPRKDAALISLAGPTTNFLIAIIISVILHILVYANFVTEPNFIYLLLAQTLIINIILGLFNLLPIHPLDGGKIFVGFLPETEAHEADQFLRRYGMLILIFLILPIFQGRSALFAFLTPLLRIISGVLLP